MVSIHPGPRVDSALAPSPGRGLDRSSTQDQPYPLVSIQAGLPVDRPWLHPGLDPEPAVRWSRSTQALASIQPWLLVQAAAWTGPQPKTSPTPWSRSKPGSPSIDPGSTPASTQNQPSDGLDPPRPSRRFSPGS